MTTGNVTLAEAIDAFAVFNAALDGYVGGTSDVEVLEPLARDPRPLADREPVAQAPRRERTGLRRNSFVIFSGPSRFAIGT